MTFQVFPGENSWPCDQCSLMLHLPGGQIQGSSIQLQAKRTVSAILATSVQLTVMSYVLSLQRPTAAPRTHWVRTQVRARAVHLLPLTLRRLMMQSLT